MGILAPKDIRYLSPRDKEWLEGYVERNGAASDNGTTYSESVGILVALARASLACEPADILAIIVENEKFIYRHQNDEDIAHMVRIALGIGEQMEDADSICFIGALYYNGTIMPQDYRKAAEYYERASKLGSSQASVNLGYCYYYGRHQESDKVKAFQCFTHGYILDNNPEAACKLGDMYAKGLVVDKDEYAAMILFDKAYRAMDGSSSCALPAHRIADMLMNSTDDRIARNPRRALQLYTQAEVCYYDEIDTGHTYYEHRLEEALKGEEEARKAIEAERSGGDLVTVYDL